jgi:beta-lactamase class A
MRNREQLQALVARPDAATGTLSVWVAAVDGGLDRAVAFAHHADVVHYAASTMKLPLLVAAYRLAEAGELELDRQVPVHNRFASAADGTPYSLDRDEDQDDETWNRLGGTATVRWLAEHATVKSGNLATNLLLEHVGTAAVAEVLADAGASPATSLPRGIEDAAARKAGLDNLVTARDLGLVLRGLAAGTLARPGTCADVEAVLSRQEHRSGIPAGLPAGTYVANKTGWVDGITHDVALVRPADRAPYVLVVLTTLDVDESEANKLIADVSRTVWEGWQR